MQYTADGLLTRFTAPRTNASQPGRVGTAHLFHHPTPPPWRAMPALLIGNMIETAGHARPTPIRRNRFPWRSRRLHRPNSPGTSPPPRINEIFLQKRVMGGRSEPALRFAF